MTGPVLIRGGGEMATGVAHVLHLTGMRVAITEIARPRAIRRLVAFAEAIPAGRTLIENITAEHVEADAVEAAWATGTIPVLVDPGADLRHRFDFPVIVDAIMSKRNRGGTEIGWAPLVIGLGPGFEARRNCHLVVETFRGHELGRFYDWGCTRPDTGTPGELGGESERRVLRAPVSGIADPAVAIGETVRAGSAVVTVGAETVVSKLSGVVRGVIGPGVEVAAGEKIADIDPRGEAAYCTRISDKARLIGAGVLTAIRWWEGGRRVPLPGNPNHI